MTWPGSAFRMREPNLSPNSDTACAVTGRVTWCAHSRSQGLQIGFISTFLTPRDRACPHLVTLPVTTHAVSRSRSHAGSRSRPRRVPEPARSVQFCPVRVRYAPVCARLPRKLGRSGFPPRKLGKSCRLRAENRSQNTGSAQFANPMSGSAQFAGGAVWRDTPQGPRRRHPERSEGSLAITHKVHYAQSHSAEGKGSFDSAALRSG